MRLRKQRLIRHFALTASASTDLSVTDRIALLSRAAVPWRSVLAAALLSLLLGAALYQGVAGERSSVAPAVRPGASSHTGLFSLPLAAQGPVSQRWAPIARPTGSAPPMAGLRRRAPRSVSACALAARGCPSARARRTWG